MTGLESALCFAVGCAFIAIGSLWMGVRRLEREMARHGQARDFQMRGRICNTPDLRAYHDGPGLQTRIERDRQNFIGRGQATPEAGRWKDDHDDQ